MSISEKKFKTENKTKTKKKTLKPTVVDENGPKVAFCLIEMLKTVIEFK